MLKKELEQRVEELEGEILLANTSLELALNRRDYVDEELTNLKQNHEEVINLIDSFSAVLCARSYEWYKIYGDVIPENRDDIPQRPYDQRFDAFQEIKKRLEEV